MTKALLGGKARQSSRDTSGGVSERRFPFGKACLALGAALIIGSPFAVRAASDFGDALFYMIALYGAGMTATLVLAILAFATTGRRTPPEQPPQANTRNEATANPYDPAPARPVPGPAVHPKGATTERVAATAGVALAGVGCGAIAGVVLFALVLLAVGGYILFEILRAIFHPLRAQDLS
jgi:hypothetical protein